MKNLKRIINISVILVLMLSMVGMFENRSNAATYLIDKENLYSKGEFVGFLYKDIKVGVEFVVYKKDGIEYPAYCLNRNLQGVTTGSGTSVSVSKTIQNAAVWRAITNGYPFKTPTELKCNSNIEAFAATKMAVYDALYTYNWSDFKAINEQGKRVILAAEAISKKARSSNASKPVGKVEIESVSETWKEDSLDKKYISKTYKVATNVESTKYTITLDGFDIENVKLTDENNKEKSEFSSSEKFKILIPVSELETKIDITKNFTIKATANLKTMPILYGETASSNYQDYALAAGEYEFENTTLKGQYFSNKTTIKIVKKDTETKNALKGAKFNILDEEKNIVYMDLETDENGIIELTGINPGKYYVEEVKSPEGYTKYDEQICAKVGFNEVYTVNVNNYKKPEEEEKKVVEEKNINVTGKKEVALPRTGF